MVWLLSRVSDAWGNYFELNYNEDPGDAGFLSDGIKLTSIEYTGHLGTSGSTTIPAESAKPKFWRVEMQYESREDVRTTRFGWVTIPRKSRLRSIRVADPAAAAIDVVRYTLTYHVTDPTHMLPSRLSNIQYCVAQGTTTHCLSR